MGEVRGRDEPHDFESYAEAVDFRVIQRIAEALREEFGVGIDAHPGGEGSEAGEVNRALRATARVILDRTVSPGDDLSLVVSWVLRQVALRRLGQLGVAGTRAEALADMEPGLGDRWLAYLTLAPASVLEDLMVGGGGRGWDQAS